MRGRSPNHEEQVDAVRAFVHREARFAAADERHGVLRRMAQDDAGHRDGAKSVE